MTFIEGNYIFGQLKQNIAVDQRVVIGRTSSDLDGMMGTILGKSHNDISDVYIVLLDIPYGGQKAINLTEVCICPLGDNK